jgi:hypothetical protein
MIDITTFVSVFTAVMLAKFFEGVHLRYIKKQEDKLLDRIEKEILDIRSSVRTFTNETNR